jgi:selenide,water dikinase
MNPTLMNPLAPLRLTSFSHGGGCGCKIAPGVLSQILKNHAGGMIPPELMASRPPTTRQSTGSTTSRR